jgi:hypothetical protein
MSNSSEKGRTAQQIPQKCKIEMTDDAILIHRPDGLTDEAWVVLRRNLKSGLDWLAKPADPQVVREVRDLGAELDQVIDSVDEVEARIEAAEQAARS